MIVGVEKKELKYLDICVWPIMAWHFFLIINIARLLIEITNQFSLSISSSKIILSTRQTTLLNDFLFL